MLLRIWKNKKFTTSIVTLFMATFLFSLYSFTTNFTPARADGGLEVEFVIDPSGDPDIEYDWEDLVDGISWVIGQVVNIFSSDNNSDNNNSKCDCGCDTSSSCCSC